MTTLVPPPAPRFRSEDHCKGCDRRILWGKTAGGKFTPVDPELVTIYDNEGKIHRGHIPHHATCTHLKDFRRK